MNSTTPQRHNTPDTLQRIAVLNRGEPAVRFIRALQEYNLERETQLEAIAFYTTPDAQAPFVRMADEAHYLGEAMLDDGSGGKVSAYCHHDHVLAKLIEHDCHAVWPGWGFVSEDPTFVKRLEQAGIIFLGPNSDAMLSLGDKVESKKLAADADVPLAPWSMIEDDWSAQELMEHAAPIGYPLVVKASAGGGGRGIRKVNAAEELEQAVRAVRDEVKKIFGQGVVFMEACITGARHIELQLVTGADGVAHAVGVRDCSIQRRHQKVIEEAPCHLLPAAQQEHLERSAERLMEIAGYRGVATAEFLYNPKEDAVFFLEVNSRLQVEHTITELVSGCDLVQAQIDIARGLPWKKPLHKAQGHAIEIRLNAEDPEQGFRPSPGLVRVFNPPSGPGIRVDSGICAGMMIAPEFDSMIAKIMAWAPTREIAIARMRRALNELEVIVEEGAMNKGFLLEVLRHPYFVEGTADTAWLDGAMGRGELGNPPREAEALMAAAIIEYRSQQHTARTRFYAQAQNGIPQQIPTPEGLRLELKLRGRTHTIEVYALGKSRYLVGQGDQLHMATFEPGGNHTATLHFEQRRHQILYTYGRSGISVEVDGATHTVERALGGVIKAPAPAMVVHVAIKEGERVSVGDTLCTLEAMKMEMPIFAQEAGVVKQVLIMANQQVTAGQHMFLLEPEQDPDAQPEQESSTWSFPQAPARPLAQLFDGERPAPEKINGLSREAAVAAINDLSSALESELLGFDLVPGLHDRLHRFISSLDLSQVQRPELFKPLWQLLRIYVDCERLYDRSLLELHDAPSAVSTDVAFYEFCRQHHDGEDGARVPYRPLLRSALSWYRVHSLDPSDDLRRALFRLSTRHRHSDTQQHLCSNLLRALMTIKSRDVSFHDVQDELIELLEHIERVVDIKQYPFVADNARQANYLLFWQNQYVQSQNIVEGMLNTFMEGVSDSGRFLALGHDAEQTLVSSPHGLLPLLLGGSNLSSGQLFTLTTRVIARRLYHLEREQVEVLETNQWLCLVKGPQDQLLGLMSAQHLSDGMASLHEALVKHKPKHFELAIISPNQDTLQQPPGLDLIIGQRWWAEVEGLERLTLTWSKTLVALGHLNYQLTAQGLKPFERLSQIHPKVAQRYDLTRLEDFQLERLDTPEHIYAFWGRARSNPKDERLFVYADVTSMPERLEGNWREHLVDFERVYYEALRVIREAQAKRGPRSRLHWNLLTFHLLPLLRLGEDEVTQLSAHFETKTRGLGLQKMVIRATIPARGGNTREVDMTMIKPGRHRLDVSMGEPDRSPIRALTPYEMRVVRTRQLRTFYPYEVARMLQGRLEGGISPHPDLAHGQFQEYDLNERDELVAVDRPYGENTCGLVVGVVSNPTPKHPEGMSRVWLASDPTFAMGALAEQECRRVIAALELAKEKSLPVEWLPISSGAKIAMDSGTENLDWTAAVLRRLIEFTQAGGVVHIIVTGVNVGAQSYWNAEATMLMHTRGVLIMTPDGSMVLTGKKALDYSGSVSAEDERSIGGYERIMGQNGQAQYFAQDLGQAYALLMEHYRFSYVAPTERWPRKHESEDAQDRSILQMPYTPVGDEPFKRIGEIFDENNAERKKPFAIREVMRATIDQDGGSQERLRAMKYAETAVIWDAHIGGHAICLIGIESRPQARHGKVPVDGPDLWTGGTLFPQSSKKVARALNAASGNRPVVVLANLSGFDGSPESLRKLQLEYGAEIGRAVVNFDGPIIFVVIGRYHGGAYVVFSKALNPNLESYAMEGTFASVIGGAPAAAVVFPREVAKRVEADERIIASRAALKAAADADKPLLRERLDAQHAQLTLEKQGELAQEFNAIHSVERAVRVGSLDGVIKPDALRPTIINALERARS